MKRYLTILFIISFFNCYSQSKVKEYKGKHCEYLKNFVFNDCHVHYNKTQEFFLFGQSYNFDCFKINSQIPVQIRESYLGDKNKFAKRKTKFILYYRQDTNYVFLDTILIRLRNDLKASTEWNKKYNQPIDNYIWTIGILRGWSSGVFLCKDFYIPFIQATHENNGSFYILWINKSIYYFELKGRPRGYGSMSSFISNSIALKINGETCNFNTLSSITMMTKIIDEFKNKYAR